MDQVNPTIESSQSTNDASTLSRLESFLSAGEAPEKEYENQDQDVQADAQEKNVVTESADETDDANESNEYQLADVAKLLGADESALDVDDDGNVLVKTKIDGQEGKVKFADIVKSYQLQGHVDKQVREVAEQRKAVEHQSQQLQSQMQIQQSLIGQVGEIKNIEAELTQYQSVDWNLWYDQAPAEASKASHHMQALQAKYHTKVNEVRAAEQGLHQQLEQSKKAMLQQEHQALLQKIPDWSSPEKQKAGITGIVEDLKARGFSDKTSKAIDENHELVLLARDAMLYRQSQAAKSTTEKAVRSAPKIIRPGTSQAQSRNVTTIQKLHSAVKGTGSRQSVVDYLLATGKV